MATRLAIKWGKSPREIMETTSQKDFAYFHAYYAMEPWGFKADAFLASVITNMAGKSIKKPTSINDFMK
jgi:hypothetical protein